MPELVLLGIRLLAKQLLGTVLDIEVTSLSDERRWEGGREAVQVCVMSSRHLGSHRAEVSLAQCGPV